METCLALEASSDACVVGLRHKGLLFARLDTTPRMHARRLMPMAEAVLEEAGLSRQALTDLAVGVGPGSFTGIRIAAGLVQGLALGLGLSVRPVCSLAATAWPIARRHPHQAIAVIRDARMGEHYVGVFQWQDGRLVQRQAPVLSAYAHTPALIAPWSPFCIGDEGETAWPDAEGLLLLAAETDPIPAAELEPAYLRGSEAWQTLSQQKGR